MDQPIDVPPSEAVKQDSVAGHAPDPQKHYDSPQSLAEDQDLDPAAREALLTEWRYDLEQRLDAEAEGMGSADTAVTPDMSGLSAELGSVASAQGIAADEAAPTPSDHSFDHAEISEKSADIAQKENTHLTQENQNQSTIRSALAAPIAEKISEVFENNPLLASAAAFATTRIALRSLTGLFAVGMIAGGLFYLRESQRTGLDDARRAARKAKKKVTRQLHKMTDTQSA